MNKTKKCKSTSSIIIQNKRAKYEYVIEKEIESGLALQGWEVKSFRSGKVNIIGSYVLFKDDEAYLFGTRFQPLTTVSSHITCNPTRTRKLLMNKRELNVLLGQVKQRGYTIVILSLYWKNAWIKAQLGVARGKKRYNKCLSVREREWSIDKNRIIKYYNL